MTFVQTEDDAKEIEKNLKGINFEITEDEQQHAINGKKKKKSNGTLSNYLK